MRACSHGLFLKACDAEIVSYLEQVPGLVDVLE